MEPDGHNEELPAPTGVTINLAPDRIIQSLQRRAAQLIQNLQWELATRDALVEVLEERLNEEAQLRQEAEGALESVADQLGEAKRQVAKLTTGQQDLLHKTEELAKRSNLTPAQRDAFLEAETVQTATARPVPDGDEQSAKPSEPTA